MALSIASLRFLSNTFFASENPCLVLPNEFGPEDVGVSLNTNINNIPYQKKKKDLPPDIPHPHSRLRRHLLRLIITILIECRRNRQFRFGLRLLRPQFHLDADGLQAFLRVQRDVVQGLLPLLCGGGIMIFIVRCGGVAASRRARSLSLLSHCRRRA